VHAFALIARSGARLSRPVEDFVARVTAHLLDRIGSANTGVRVAPGANDRGSDR